MDIWYHFFNLANAELESFVWRTKLTINPLRVVSKLANDSPFFFFFFFFFFYISQNYKSNSFILKFDWTFRKYVYKLVLIQLFSIQLIQNILEFDISHTKIVASFQNTNYQRINVSLIWISAIINYAYRFRLLVRNACSCKLFVIALRIYKQFVKPADFDTDVSPLLNATLWLEIKSF